MDEYTYTDGAWLYLLKCVIRAWWPVSDTKMAKTCDARSEQDQGKIVKTDKKLEVPPIRRIVSIIVPSLHAGA